MSARLRRWISPIWLLLAVPGLIFHRGLLGKVLIAPGDGYQAYLPWHVLSGRILRTGHLPTWNPFAFSGYPLLANHQSAVFYPANLLFVVMDELLANNIGVALNFVIAGVGTYLLIGRFTKDRWAGTIGGLIFAFCGFMFGHIGHQSINSAIAWLPWVLFGFELIRQRFSIARLLIGSASIALCALAGQSQMFALVLLTLFLYAGILAVLDIKTSRLKPLALAAIMAITGTALGAIQLLPVLSILGQTDRTAVSYSEAMTYSFPKSHIVLIFFPYLFGNNYSTGFTEIGYLGNWNLTEMAGYPGLAAVILASIGLVTARRDRRVIALGLTALFTAVLAFGTATPLSRLMYQLPVFGQFRAWARYVVVLDLTVAVIAGLGVAALRRVPRQKNLVLGGIAAFLVLLMMGFGLTSTSTVSRYIPADGWASGLIVPLSFALLALLTVVLFRTDRRLVASSLLATIVIADSFLSFGGSYEWNRESLAAEVYAHEAKSSDPYAWGVLDDAPGGVERYLFIGADIGPMGRDWVHATSLKSVRSANGNDPLAPSMYLNLVGMGSFGSVYRDDDIWRSQSDILDLLRVSTVLIDPESSDPLPSADSKLIGGTPVSKKELLRFTYQPQLPDTYLVGAVRRVSTNELPPLLYGLEEFDPTTTALIETPCRKCPGANGTIEGRVLRRRMNLTSVEVEVETRSSSMLIVSQAWFPGWKATVDGRPADVLRVNGLVQGVPLNAGDKRVRLYYVAPGFRLGVLITVFTLGLLLLGLAVGHLRKRAGTEQEERALS